MAHRVADRRLILVAAVVMDTAFGAVQAWSVFRNPLMETFGWTISAVTLTYTVHYVSVGVGAVLGGLWLARVGPLRAGTVAGLLYGGGVALATLAADRLWILYVTWGLVSGVGRGMGAVVPVATAVRWFPDRRGTASGLPGVGFGMGALLAAPLATRLIGAYGVLPTFGILGVGYAAVVVLAAAALADPPEGFRGFGERAGSRAAARGEGGSRTLGQGLRTWQLHALFALVLANAAAGLGLMSQAGPLAEELTGVDPVSAGWVVGLIAGAYAVGRASWAWLSDLTGRKWALAALFVVQGAALWALPGTAAAGAFTALALVALLCHGGVVGVVPAALADYFGARHVGALFGFVVGAQATGGVLGPMLLALVRDATGGYGLALLVIAGLMGASAVLSALLSPPFPEVRSR